MPRIQVPSFIAPAPAVDHPDAQAITKWVVEAFAAQGRALQEFENVKLTALNTEPIRPRDGMVAFADGTNWNPGSGSGAYVYDGAWVPLGGAGGAGNTFSTIAVASQSSVVADTTGDTLTLIAGSNITLTTDATNDSVTIAATGGGGGISNVVEDTSPTLGGNLEGGGFSVGTLASPIADLFLAAGGVINWNNSDVEIAHSSGFLNITSAVPSFIIQIKGDDSGAQGPSLNLLHDSASPAVSDIVGSVIFQGRDSGAGVQTYGGITSGIISPTAGAEKGFLQWIVASNGANRTIWLSGDANVLGPEINDTFALGTGSFAWSDLHLASGGVIGWNNSAVTVTHSSNALTFAGGNIAMAGTHLSVGSSTVNTGAGIFYGGTIPVTGSDHVCLQLSPDFSAASGTFSSVFGIACASYLSGGATWTNAYNIIAETWFKDAGVTVTNAYSLYVQAQNVGSTLNRSIYVEGGVSEFDGQLIAKGTATNDNAATGDIGEFVESEITFGSAISLTTNTAANVTSISLTAGDWDVFGNVLFAAGASTTSTTHIGWISTTSATLPTAPNKGSYAYMQTAHAAGENPGLSVGMRRISLSSTTTVYLSAYSTFAVSTMQAYGYIGARRAR